MVTIISTDVVTQFARPLSDFDHNWGEEEEVNENRAKKEKENLFKGVAYTIKKQ